MVSKFVHFLKYGILGALIGGMIKTFTEWDNHFVEVKPLIIWCSVGALGGILVSVIMEKWFNGTFHD